MAERVSNPHFGINYCFGRLEIIKRSENRKSRLDKIKRIGAEATVFLTVVFAMSDAPIDVYDKVDNVTIAAEKMIRGANSTGVGFQTQEQRDAANYLNQAIVRGEEVQIFNMKADRSGAKVTNVPILGLEGMELGNDENRVLRVLKRFDEGESLNVSRWYGSFPLVYEHGSTKFAVTILDSGEVGFVPWKDLK